LANPSNSPSSYFDNIDRIAAEDYMPSQHDIMLLGTNITDLSDTTFFARGRLHRFFELDAEQVRQELPHGPISALIAFVDLSTFCQPLTAGADTNGPFNAIMELLGSMSMSMPSWFGRIPLIVMFNKMDIFIQRFTLSAFRHHFPDYDGPDDYERAVRYLLTRFTETIEPLWVSMPFLHLTCVTKTANTRLIWEACLGKYEPPPLVSWTRMLMAL
jgi:guanine nucleotide-binding protein subunit alpha